MARLTLEDIGRKARVSRATVSRVINNHPNISDEVRERVWRIIEETGYQPNIAARTLASSESRIIGLVIPAVLANVFSDPYYPQLMQGVAAACNDLDYTLTLFLFQTQAEQDRAMKRLVGNTLLDGVMIHADYSDPTLPRQLARARTPFVQIGRTTDDQDNITYVDTDNYQGGYLATQHLIAQSYTRIAQVATAMNMAGNDRDRGYRDALQENDMPIIDDLIVYADFSEAKAYTMTQHLLEHQPDAIFCQSDTMALGTLQAIHDAGLRVPNDMAVVGFDDLLHAALSDPPLTTIRQDVTGIGYKAVELLQHVIQSPKSDPQHVQLPVELIIRQSTK
ncbi:MAG: LacI family DNA-binding transcriptional regulator [Chloroflexota bacterium]